MDFYHVFCDHRQEEPPIEGHHSYYIPLITCPHCGNERGKSSISYPWIDVKKAFDAKTRTVLRNGFSGDITWEEFQNIRNAARPFLEPWLILPPGINFGQYAGKVFATPSMPDVIMPTYGVLLARRVVVDEWNSKGCNLKFDEIALRQRPGEVADMVELWAPPVAKAGRASGVKWCEYCDRGSVPKEHVVDSKSVPEGTHFFQMKDDPFPVVSEKLARLIKEKRLSGFRLEPLGVE